jgi:hypothetical protein
VTKPAFRSHRLKDGLCEGSSGGFAEDPGSLDVAIDERRGRDDQEIYGTAMCLVSLRQSRSGFNPSENRHEGEIAKLREMVAVEAHRGKS